MSAKKTIYLPVTAHIPPARSVHIPAGRHAPKETIAIKNGIRLRPDAAGDRCSIFVRYACWLLVGSTIAAELTTSANCGQHHGGKHCKRAACRFRYGAQLESVDAKQLVVNFRPKSSRVRSELKHNVVRAIRRE